MTAVLASTCTPITREHRDVEVEADLCCAGVFAVHPRIEWGVDLAAPPIAGVGWVLTHVPTGCGFFIDDPLPSKALALAVAEKLRDVLDWKSFGGSVRPTTPAAARALALSIDRATRSKITRAIAAARVEAL